MVLGLLLILLLLLHCLYVCVKDMYYSVYVAGGGAEQGGRKPAGGSASHPSGAVPHAVVTAAARSGRALARQAGCGKR